MITFDRACRFLHTLWRNRNQAPPPTVFLMGPPGIGKTALLTDVAKRMGPEAVVEILDLTSRSPEDIGGLPFRENGETRYSPQSWAIRMSKPDAVGCLVFDDLPAATSATAIAVRQVVLDRRVHDVRLAPGILIVVTGNRREDMAGAMTLPSHFRNSICTLELEPDFSSWSSWFLSNGGVSDIPAFLRWKPDMFAMLPKQADTLGRFATPRTWTLFSKSLPSALESNCVSEVAAGFLGEGVACEYLSFREVLFGLPDPEWVYQNPKEAIPNPKAVLSSPDKLIAICSNIGHHAAIESKRVNLGGLSPHKHPDMIRCVDLMFRAVAWCIGDNVEYAAAALSAFNAAGGSMNVVQVYTHNNPPAEVYAMVQQFRNALT